MTLLDINLGYKWPCCWCCRLLTVLCVSPWKCAWQLVLSFVIYGNHICVVHILSIACAGNTRNLLITEVIISVLACERSGMYINSTTFLTRYFHVLTCSSFDEKLSCVVPHKFLHFPGFLFDLLLIWIMECGSYLVSELFSWPGEVCKVECSVGVKSQPFLIVYVSMNVVQCSLVLLLCNSYLFYCNMLPQFQYCI